MPYWCTCGKELKELGKYGFHILQKGRLHKDGTPIPEGCKPIAMKNLVEMKKACNRVELVRQELDRAVDHLRHVSEIAPHMVEDWVDHWDREDELIQGFRATHVAHCDGVSIKGEKCREYCAVMEIKKGKRLCPECYMRSKGNVWRKV